MVYEPSARAGPAWRQTKSVAHLISVATELITVLPIFGLDNLLHLMACGTFMVIVQFHGRLVRQYRACVVESLRLGITCLISLYYVYKASRSCLS